MNTKKTESDLKWYGEKRDTRDISPQALNCLLSHLFIKVRRRDGRDHTHLTKFIDVLIVT